MLLGGSPAARLGNGLATVPRSDCAGGLCRGAGGGVARSGQLSPANRSVRYPDGWRALRDGTPIENLSLDRLAAPAGPAVSG